MTIFLCGIGAVLILDVMVFLRFLSLGRYPRITMLPVMDEKGQPSKLEVVQKFSALGDKLSVISRLMALTAIAILLTN